jgi:hypothetical protein
VLAAIALLAFATTVIAAIVALILAVTEQPRAIEIVEQCAPESLIHLSGK